MSSDLSSREPKRNLFTDTNDERDLSNQFNDERDLSNQFNDARDLNILFNEEEIVIAYQHKTYVLNSDNTLDFGTDDEKKVTILNAHAPEIFQDEEGQWYISSVEWPNRGVSVDKLEWVTQ